MGMFDKMIHRVFDVREKRPAEADGTVAESEAVEPVGEAASPADAADEAPEAIGWSEEVAAASKGVFSEGHPEEGTDDFPAEGEMTDAEAKAVLDLVSDPYGNLVGTETKADGEEYEVHDMSARAGMKVVEVETEPVDGEAGGEAAADDEPVTAAESEETAAEPVEGEVGDEGEPVAADAEPSQDEDDSASVTFRASDDIEPLGFDAPFEASHATGEMLASWHLRLVFDHGMPEGDDEPIVELYDGESGEFVSDYWVSTFCDDSDEREGQGLACKGAVKRFRIAYDDLVGMQGLVRPLPVVEEWYAAHEDDMPDHNI